MSDEAQREIDAWMKRQLDSHPTHLFKNGLIDGRVQVAIAWALPGRLCIGVVRSQTDPAKAFWVISGDVPTDHILHEHARDAREAAKHFALKWQLQATRLTDSQSVGRADDAQVMTEAGATLRKKGEALYAITEMGEHWQTEIIGG